MQEEKLKGIISRYTKIPADQIGHQTMIDRTTIASSILLHRMYADLANDGFEVTGYWDIKNYQMLINRLGVAGQEQAGVKIQTAPPGQENNADTGSSGIGIDIEETNKFAAISDFREDKFYTMNFSSSEISYAIMQPDPLVTFAGLFAAKEAIVKANNNYKELPFNNILIDHQPSGKPVHPDFDLSISHTANLSVAVAVEKKPLLYSPSAVDPTIQIPVANHSFLYIISFAAIVLSIIAIILAIVKF
ncbi:MAG: 4'-phosphopantetheinyl transferase superfamily protein [Ferruginibacter sp.]